MTTASERLLKGREFLTVANVLARTKPGMSAGEVARTSSDFYDCFTIMRNMEKAERLNGLYDISAFALPFLGLDSASIVDQLSQESVNISFSVPVRVGSLDSPGLSVLTGRDSKRLAKSSATSQGNDLVKAVAHECIRSAGNREAIAALLNSATQKVLSSGGEPAAILEDLSSALAGLAITASSRIFLIVDACTAANLSLKSSGGVLTFPNIAPSGGEISAAVRAIVVDPADLPVVDDSDRRALVVDAAGLMVNPGAVGLARTTSQNHEGVKGNQLDDEVSFTIEAVRTFGMQAHRACVAVIENLKW